MYFPLDPESRPKSTWQIGQATQGLEEERRTGRGGRRRPRDASTGREGTEDWLNGGEEDGGGADAHDASAALNGRADVTSFLLLFSVFIVFLLFIFVCLCL